MPHPLRSPIFCARLSTSVAESCFRSRLRGCVIMPPVTCGWSIVLTKITNRITLTIADNVESMWC